MEEERVRGVMWNDAILVVELEVVEAELNCALVGLRIGVFARAQTEEQGNLDNIGGALGDLAGGAGYCCGCHDESKGGSLLRLGRGVLVRKVP